MRRRRVVAMARPCRRVKSECSMTRTRCTPSPKIDSSVASTSAGTAARLPMRALFAHAEACEDPPQEVLRRELSGDLAQTLLRIAELLRHELALAPLRQLAGLLHMPARP